MSLIKSFLYNIKEAKYNPITLTHNMFYIPTVSYLRVLKYLVKFNSKRFRNYVLSITLCVVQKLRYDIS